MSIDVLNETDYDVDPLELVACARYVLGELRVHPQAELCVRLVDEEAMTVLHEKWMDLPGPTDVMSFPMDELRPGSDGVDPEEGLLGDIVLCPPVAQRQAREAGHAVEEELLLLTTHGILHLLGYDHAEPAQEKEMFDLQRRLLLTFLATRGRDATGSLDPVRGTAGDTDSAGGSGGPAGYAGEPAGPAASDPRD